MGPDVPGQLAILFALVTTVLSGVTWAVAARGGTRWESLARRSYHVFAVMVGLALVYLFYLFLSHNYAFQYTYNYSERQQPWLYVFAGLWGGQEGTYLLWAMFVGLFGYGLLRYGGPYRAWGMAVYALVNLFFLFIMTRVSPFKLLPVPQPDGAGLNPLLRDPWMVAHPPVMFVGYAAAAVPFAIALAALIRNDYREWARRAFPWVAITALMLAAGNILGGYWAYKTLGWGGYWAWDPVENSSFIPWMISLALLHGLLIERRTGALRRTNLLLAAVVFVLVIYGTFLTRSGILADFSVHSFTDLGVNGYLVGFMALYTALTLGLFLFRAARIPSAPLTYNLFHKEFSLFTGLVTLVIVAAVVLFWTSLPVLTSWFSDQPRAADLATYNNFALPLAIVMALLLTFAPLVNYARRRIGPWQTATGITLAVSAAVSAVVTMLWAGQDVVFAVVFWLVLSGLAVFIMVGRYSRAMIPALAAGVVAVLVALGVGVHTPMYLLFFATAAMAAVANLVATARLLPAQWRLVGGRLTHFGFGIMLVGILASSAFTTHEKVALPVGQPGEAFGMTLEYRGMKNAFDHPNNELIITLTADGGSREINPQLYYSKRMDGLMRKPYIKRRLLADYYFAPQQIQAPEEHQDLVLTKGERKKVGDFEFEFIGYRMGDHANTGEGLTVTAELAVAYGDERFELTPSLRQVVDSDGHAHFEPTPAVLEAGGESYAVSIERILADQGAITLTIPGLLGSGEAETLILDVSRKPLMYLVWFGTTLILIGGIIVVIRRRGEIAEPAPVPVAARDDVPTLVS